MVSSEPMGGPPTSADHRFCRELLPAVSRSFALSIEALPGERAEALRRPVRCAYLLCRVLDTIEDAALAPDSRGELLAAFDEALAADAVDPRRLERGFVELLGEDVAEAERRLAGGSGAVLRVFAGLPAADRRAIRGPVQTMSAGMRRYVARGHRITDLADLERYCYYVAGTVGELLDQLFVERCPVSLAEAAARREAAVSFGIGLQLVNIVKDVADDLPRGRCFVPGDLLAAAGLQPEELLLPLHREAALGLLTPLIDQAEHHLDRAAAYTAAWPAADRAGQAIRLFCAVPLALARASLALVRRADSTLRPGLIPKVSRTTVVAIVAAAGAASRSDERLEELLAGPGAATGPRRSAPEPDAEAPPGAPGAR